MHASVLRAFYLADALGQNSRLWSLLPDVMAGRHLDFWWRSRPAGSVAGDILVDFRDRFRVSYTEALRATRLVIPPGGSSAEYLIKKKLYKPQAMQH